MTYRAYIIIASLLISVNVPGQNIIDSVAFSGLKKTQPKLLHRFIKSTPGTTLDSMQANNDLQNLLNLNIFSSASWNIERQNEKLILHFTCNEIITTFPVFNFGSIGEQTFFKVGLTNANFMGRLGIYRLYYLNYDGHSFYYEHEVPYIQNSGFGLAFDVKKVSTLEPLYFGRKQILYNYTNNYIGVEGFYEFKLNRRVKLKLAGFNEMFMRKNPSVKDTVDFIEGNKCSIKATYRSGRLNYLGCNVSGFDNNFYVNAVYTFGDRPFYQGVNTFKYFVSFQQFSTVAVRLKMGLSSNNTGPFAPYAIDSYMNIRGVGSKIDRGTGQIVLNMEYRQNIINSNKWGSIQLVAFADIGTWRLPGGAISDFTEPENIKIFSGIGSRIFLSRVYNLTLRGDIGINSRDFSMYGVVLGIGQYF